MQLSYLEQILDFDLLKEDEFTLKSDQDTLFTGQVQVLEPGHYLIQSQGNIHDLWLFQEKDKVQVYYQGEYYFLKRQIKSASGKDAASNSNLIEAPLTGKVFKVPVEVGQKVEAGMPVVILESMKMETSLNAPFDARIEAIHCEEGEQVTTEQLLVELAPIENTPLENAANE